MKVEKGGGLVAVSTQERPATLFATALRRYMEYKGWTQAELADRIGKAESAVSRWMNGWGARQSTVEEVAAKLGMTSAELLNWGYDAPPEPASFDEIPAEARQFALKYARLPEEQRKAIRSLIDTLIPLEAMNAPARERTEVLVAV